jgi:hypothetical protein
MAKSTRKTEGSSANLGFEAKLWAAADALRNNMDAAEYKHVLLGLIFLKYISDAFESKHAELEGQKKQGADPEDRDEYRAASIFWVPKEARWSHIKASAPQPTIGTLVDDAMAAIERDNQSLKGVLPKDSATAGDDWVRPALCEEALRLARVLAGLAPDESEVHGVVALLEIQASRIGARTTADGEPILLLDQDRSRWNRLLIQRGLTALEKAESLTGALGPFTLQAAIAACHARARTADETEWTRITALYDALAQLTPSPVIELNRAVAYSMAFGPAEGLSIVVPLLEDAAMKSYHLLHAVRADFLFKLGRFGEARSELEKAVGMVRNEREKRMLEGRLRECEKREGTRRE